MYNKILYIFLIFAIFFSELIAMDSKTDKSEIIMRQVHSELVTVNSMADENAMTLRSGRRVMKLYNSSNHIIYLSEDESIKFVLVFGGEKSFIEMNGEIVPENDLFDIIQRMILVDYTGNRFRVFLEECSDDK